MRSHCNDCVTALYQVTGALYSSVEPTPTGKLASLVAFSPEAAALIGLNAGQRHRQEFIDAMAGASRLPGSNGCATCVWALSAQWVMEFYNHRVCVTCKCEISNMLAQQARLVIGSWDLSVRV